MLLYYETMNQSGIYTHGNIEYFGKARAANVLSERDFFVVIFFIGCCAVI